MPEIEPLTVTDEVKDLLLEPTRRKILRLCLYPMTPQLLCDKLNGRKKPAVMRHLRLLEFYRLVKRMAKARSLFNPNKLSEMRKYSATNYGRRALVAVGEVTKEEADLP